MPEFPTAFPEIAEQTLQPISGRPGPWLQLFNPAGFEWNIYDLPVRRLPATLEGLRIVQITDAHLRPWPKWFKAYDRVIEHLAADPPDLIILSGDLLEHKFDFRPSLPIVERFVAGLKSKLGTFAILGNHDGDLFGAHFARLGINLIHGRYLALRDDATMLELIGVPGMLRSDARDGLLEKIPARPNNSLRIVVAHYPDTIRLLFEKGIDADIVLAGHTHGGQVCLPGRRPIIQHDSLRKPYYKGVHRFGETWLVIPRGLGFATYPIRLFCPAEIVELRLKRS